MAEQEHILCRNGFSIVLSKTYHGMLDRTSMPRLLKLLYRGICFGIPRMRESLATVARKPEGGRPTEADPEAFRKSMVGSVPPGVE